MAIPVAPPGYQGDLVDPATGRQLLRIQAAWETVPLPPKPDIAVVEPPPLDEEIPSQDQRWVWTAHGYYLLNMLGT